MNLSGPRGPWQIGLKTSKILNHLKLVIKDNIVFTGLWLNVLNTFTGGRLGGWVACLKMEIRPSQPQLKLKLS